MYVIVYLKNIYVDYFGVNRFLEYMENEHKKIVK